MSAGTSTFVIRWINFLTMILGLGVICFGIWMSTHHDKCHKTLTLPAIGLGALILLISFVGFIGALKNIIVLLWVYLAILFLILVAILVFTVLAFIITNSGSGHAVSGIRFKEYHLQDYSFWFLKQVGYPDPKNIYSFYILICELNICFYASLWPFKLNNTKNWGRLKSCLVKSDDCNNLPNKYKTLKSYKSAELTPIEAGCCRPPSECGYPAINASYYDLSYHPTSTGKDCGLYKNARNVKCYDCDSCKAGVAQFMKTEWRVVAIFNVILFVILSAVYLVACCARRNAASSNSLKEGRR